MFYILNNDKKKKISSINKDGGENWNAKNKTYEPIKFQMNKIINTEGGNKTQVRFEHCIWTICPQAKRKSTVN